MDRKIESYVHMYEYVGDGEIIINLVIRDIKRLMFRWSGRPKRCIFGLECSRLGSVLTVEASGIQRPRAVADSDTVVPRLLCKC